MMVEMLGYWEHREQRKDLLLGKVRPPFYIAFNFYLLLVNKKKRMQMRMQKKKQRNMNL
jgi:hypothetical protein